MRTKQRGRTLCRLLERSGIQPSTRRLLFPSHRERREQVQVNRPAHRQIADAVDLIAGSAGRAFGNEFGDRTTLWARACFCVEPAETLGRASFPRAGPLYLVPTLVK